MHSSIYIAIKLRTESDPAVFLTLDYLLATVCHELAHCWHINHGAAFVRRTDLLVRHVEQDLGGRVEIQRRVLADGEEGTFVVVEKGEEGMMQTEKEERRTEAIGPSVACGDAVEEWEREVWEMKKKMKEKKEGRKTSSAIWKALVEENVWEGREENVEVRYQ